MNKKNSHIFLLVFCTMFFVYQYGMRSAIPSVLNEDLQRYFVITASELGSLISLFYLSYTIMQIPVGIIIDKVKPKWIAVIAFSLFSMGIIAFICSQNYGLAALSQIFLGCSSSFAFVLIMKVTNDYFSSEKVAMVSSIAISAGSLGPVMAGPALAYLSTIFYWKNVVMCAGFLGFVFSLLGIVFLKDTPSLNSMSQLSKKLSLSESLKLITRDTQYIWIGLFSMMLLGAISTFTDAWGISFLRHFYGYNKEQAAFAVSLVYLGNILGGPIIARISEILGSYKKVMLMGSILFFILFLNLAFIRMPIYILYPLLFIIGGVVSCQFLAFPAALLLAPREVGATLTGVVNTITMLGSTLLIKGMGYVLDLSKGDNINYSAVDYQISMCLLLMAIIFAIFTVPFIKDRYPSKG